MNPMRADVVLADGDIVLRLPRRRDARAWGDVRVRNASWLRPWDATLPAPDPSVPTTFAAMVRYNHREARAGRMWSFSVFYSGRLVGQVTLGGVSYGSLRSGYVGYWIDEGVAGMGIIPTGVALVSDFAFSSLRLHRLEINVRPENAPSSRVAEKLGFRLEGARAAYLHIDGDWRDHVTYVLFGGDLPDGVLATFLGSATPSERPPVPEKGDGSDDTGG
ncbi:MAG: GNAT family protein [Candidatus Nanopelagicales bacterium]|nr:GNAT family protein [Candidatus Nanopelagicales bacterium]MDZ4249588.1 GNAT family protein [Candidatus Nanopelagicales bacterium]MDZ7579034.1 GNAT family protein [Candidatus Nanopelagicales bacterium]